ncbi:hypothetical protein CPB84DRAFT_1814685 [Gymnopilus junonius]|uniref:BTB domain-containing protein n=1 Tax=Gymnopilus junonius TaxID=109634 RepID=A0A9P5NQS5_GYMJU|nr:hypothetical protein CPB84DRAFT_1814685 [Gymnopilus junonius]
MNLDQPLYIYEKDQVPLPLPSDQTLVDENPDYFASSIYGPAEPPSLQSYVQIPVSTAFHANAIPPPNTLFLSSDGVSFHVRNETILESSPRHLKHISRQQIIRLDAPSAELNIILHALYGTSAAAYSPDTNILVNAIDRMPTYGILPQSVIWPLTHLYYLLLSHAPICPLKIYALAAHHNISALAISASAHLLSYDLTTITDDMAERIGAIYLKKLLTLHIERNRSLKQILLRPPHPHPPTNECSFTNQDRLTRTWALVSAHFVWDVQPDITDVPERLSCGICLEVLEDKIKDTVVQWASVKRTI